MSTARTLLLSLAALAPFALIGCSGQATQADAADSPADTPASSPVSARADTAQEEPKSLMTEYTPDTDPAYVLGHTMLRLDGEDENLETYKGKVVLIVNTASKCGFTPQYKGLQSLYESKKADGLVVLGFPSDNFGGQEFDTNAEVASFCEANYGVEFPMFEIVDVKGDKATPLFKQLAEQTGAEPRWNFTKYLVGRDGKVVAQFGSNVKPESDELVGKINELLAG